jgi:hypothetical protein
LSMSSSLATGSKSTAEMKSVRCNVCVKRADREMFVRPGVLVDIIIAGNGVEIN